MSERAYVCVIIAVRVQDTALRRHFEGNRSAREIGWVRGKSALSLSFRGEGTRRVNRRITESENTVDRWNWKIKFERGEERRGRSVKKLCFRLQPTGLAGAKFFLNFNVEREEGRGRDGEINVTSRGDRRGRKIASSSLLLVFFFSSSKFT